MAGRALSPEALHGTFLGIAVSTLKCHETVDGANAHVAGERVITAPPVSFLRCRHLTRLGARVNLGAISIKQRLRGIDLGRRLADAKLGSRLVRDLGTRLHASRLEVIDRRLEGTTAIPIAGATMPLPNSENSGMR